MFMDVKIESGEPYIAAINDQLDAAVAVLVLWTEASVKIARSRERSYLLAEVERGYSRGVLVAAAFDKIALEKLPVPFNIPQASDLSDWIETGGSATHFQWQNVLKALGEKLQRPSLVAGAIALEDGSENAKRTFLRNYPDDPLAKLFADELEGTARREFASQVEAIRRRIRQRTREMDKTLEKSSGRFEALMGDLRSGKDVWPPDILDEIQDNPIFLKEKIANLEAALEETKERSRTDERRAGQAEEAASALKAQLADSQHVAAQLGTRMEAADRVAAQTADEVARLNGLILDHQNAAAEANGRADRAQQTTVQTKAQVDELESSLANARLQLTEQAARTAEFDSLCKREGDLQLALQSKILENETVEKTLANLSRRHRLSLITAGCAVLVALALSPIVLEAFGLNRDFNKELTDLQAANRDLAAAKTTAENEITALKSQQAGALSGLKAQQASAVAEIAALKAQLDRSRQAETTLTSREAAVVNGEKSLAAKEKTVSERFAEITKKENDLAAQTTGIEKRANEIGKKEAGWRCDEMTSYQYDRDRPGLSSWKDDTSKIPLVEAKEACEIAVNGADSKEQERRFRLQLGRVYSGIGFQQLKEQKSDDARESFKIAVGLWKRAAELDSGQANNVLGIYYRGDYGDPPQQKDLKTAWSYFKRAADLGNPIGLTTAAFGLLLPDWNENITDTDLDLGRRYLEQARRWEYSRTYFVLGLAYKYGRGYRQNPDEAARYLGIAYCMNDASSKRLWKGTPPKCDEVY